MKTTVKLTAIASLSLLFLACGNDKNTNQKDTPSLETNGIADNTIKVTLETLSPQRFEHFFEVSGTVKSDFDVYLSPEMNGQIKAIFVKEGDRVAKGQPLLKLNTSVIQNNINEVKTSLELAKLVYEKQKKLWEVEHVGSEIQYLEAKTKKESLEQRLKTLQAQLQLSELKAPFSGVIDKIMKKQGEVVAPGMPVMELVNTQKLYVDADIAETYLPNVKLNDSVYVKFPALGNNFMVRGIIARIGNVINPANRTFTTRINLTESNPLLKPNLMAYVGVRDYLNDSAMVVPTKVILQDNKGYFVFKAEKDKALKTYVEPLFTSGEKTAVASGNLHFGDKIIIDGYNQVTSNATIKVVSK